MDSSQYGYSVSVWSWYSTHLTSILLLGIMILVLVFLETNLVSSAFSVFFSIPVSHCFSSYCTWILVSRVLSLSRIIRVVLRFGIPYCIIWLWCNICRLVGSCLSACSSRPGQSMLQDMPDYSSKPAYNQNKLSRNRPFAHTSWPWNKSPAHTYHQSSTHH